ncbi:ArsR/SmtB family transcription factor [Agrococcus jejuensis]|uniref:DNA-binding transcriptional regulator, ArsR family n=1 Tax=Agrococcus jejuensis TaxID=399736 RepID=A0A1G8E2H6_9MICO|nr:metalloregulator ArsR/SmtB family transcription factor [Agrococcus jejuensis]SDH64045.1 DNA-binding transcriptional regulator, ArsR family [Agrococcus jejuensis]
MHADNDARGVCQRYDLAAEVFGMLADATRVRIIVALRGGELPVGEIAERVGKTPAAASQHLAKLRLARMVLTRHEGTKVFYRLADDHASQLVADAVHQAEHTLGIAPQHAETAEEPTDA